MCDQANQGYEVTESVKEAADVYNYLLGRMGSPEAVATIMNAMIHSHPARVFQRVSMDDLPSRWVRDPLPSTLDIQKRTASAILDGQ